MFFSCATKFQKYKLKSERLKNEQSICQLPHINLFDSHQKTFTVKSCWGLTQLINLCSRCLYFNLKVGKKERNARKDASKQGRSAQNIITNVVSL